MTTPGPDSSPEPGRGPDDPDLEDPLTAEDILAQAGAPEALDRLPASDSQASRLVALAQLHYQLVNGTDGRPYATPVGGPAIAYNLRGRDALRTRLARLYFDTYTQAASGTALTDALAVLEGLVERTDPQPVALRVARAAEHSIVVDLGGTDGRCVVADPTGWRIVARSPVLFRRSVLTAPLPEPQPGGSLDVLQQLVNVDEGGFRLLVAWLVAALIPDIPHPILALFGEQGTAKSTAARLLVGLVDPSPAPLRTPPREMRSWAAAAHASWVIALDNLSSIPLWLSDTLCKAVTGDGVVERTLNTDDDINVLAFRRVVALTSIDAGRLAGDLVERLLPVELDPIPPDKRRPDTEITADYEAARSRLLGAVLDLTAQTLNALPRVHLGQLPRMADFAHILAALDHTQGWTTLADYTAAATETALAALEYEPVATAIRDLVGRGGGWKGTHSDLLDRLTPDHPPKDWPKSPRALAGALARLAPGMRTAWGISVERPPRGQNRTLTIRSGQDPVPGASNE